MFSPCREAATSILSVVADQGGHWGDPAGDGDPTGRGGGGRAVLRLGGDVEVGAAVEVGAPRCCQRCQVWQRQVGFELLRPLRVGRAFGRDERVVQRKEHWAVWLIEVRGGGQSNRIGGEQVGLRTGYVQVSNRGVQIDLTFVAGDIGVQCANPSAGGSEGVDLYGAVGCGLGNGPCTCASTRTDCQDTPGAGAIAGA